MITNIPVAADISASALRLYFTAIEMTLTALETVGQEYSLVPKEIVDRRIVVSATEVMTEEESKSWFEDFLTRSQPALQLIYSIIQQSQERTKGYDMRAEPVPATARSRHSELGQTKWRLHGFPHHRRKRLVEGG
jgi:hypothetical protein